MRIIHAVEEKARELGGDLAASVEFWEDILREEFDGSVSKLREALGGQKSNEEEIGRFKKRCRELLQQGLVRMAKKKQQVDSGMHAASLMALVQPPLLGSSEHEQHEQHEQQEEESDEDPHLDTDATDGDAGVPTEEEPAAIM